jgi:hypothetical protein
VQQLLDEGLVSATCQPLAEQTGLSSTRFLVPVDSENGWEVAVFDHFRAMLDAIARKLRLRSGQSEAAAFVGGATLVFDVHPEHPMRAEVLGLLERVRTEVNEVWARASEYNRHHPIEPAQHEAVTFYFGQSAELINESQSS